MPEADAEPERQDITTAQAHRQTIILFAVLKESITFGTTSKYQLLKLYNVDVKEVKDEEGLILEKSTQSLKSDYVKKLE